MTAVLILNYNNAEATRSCIASILRCNSATVKFVVVDNGSSGGDALRSLESFLQETFTDGFLRLGDGEEPRGPLPRMTFLASASNDGYARGNNKGLRLLDADDSVSHVLVMNNDVLFVQDIIPSLEAAYAALEQEGGRPGILSPLLAGGDGVRIDPLSARTDIPAGALITRFGLAYPLFPGIYRRAERRCSLVEGRAIPPGEAPFETEVPNGSFLFLSKELFRRIGWFDEGTFLYYEENILFRKLRAAGCRNWCLPSLRAIHLGADTTRRSGSRFLLQCAFESADRYLRGYVPMSPVQRLRWAWVRRSFPLKADCVFGAKKWISKCKTI